MDNERKKKKSVEMSTGYVKHGHYSRPHRRDEHSAKEQNQRPWCEIRVDVKQIANRILKSVERQGSRVIHLVCVAVELHHVRLAEVRIDVRRVVRAVHTNPDK